MPLTKEDMTKVTGKKGGQVRHWCGWYSWAQASNKAREHEDEIVTPPTVLASLCLCVSVCPFGAGLGGELGRVHLPASWRGHKRWQNESSSFRLLYPSLLDCSHHTCKECSRGDVLCSSDPPQVGYHWMSTVDVREETCLSGFGKISPPATKLIRVPQVAVQLPKGTVKADNMIPGPYSHKFKLLPRLSCQQEHADYYRQPDAPRVRVDTLMPRLEIS